MIRFQVPKVNAGISGCRSVAPLQLSIDRTDHKHLILDFAGYGWFDAGMCAALGVVLAQFRRDGGVVETEGISSFIRPVFERNGFAYSRSPWRCSTATTRRFRPAVRGWC